jgi:hypothetical protein
MPDPDIIRSAMLTPCPPVAGSVWASHWPGVCTVCTDAGQWFLVTGYNRATPRLSACRHAVHVDIASIYHVFGRDDPAIAALGMHRAPQCHYTV